MNKLKTLLITSILTLAVTGCQTTRQNAYTGESEMNDTTSGALIGCATGALAGALINKGKGAAIGCAAGGAGGAAIGYQMDKQEAMLRQELVNSGIQIKRVGEQIKLVMSGDITFKTGRSDLTPSILPSLRSVAKVMNNFEDTMLIVEGHTDSVGKDAYNMQLSSVRAQTVQREIAVSGLSYSRIKAEAYGEMRPLCSNNTKSGQACNRRVELLIVPR